MWSPQQYLNDGIDAGIDPKIIRNALFYIDQVKANEPELPALLTLRHLAERSEADYQVLRSAVKDSTRHYRHFRIRKRSGGHRVISVPEPNLALAQRWINAHILSSQDVHRCSHAFKPKSSIKRCAARHVGARWLIKLDVAGFFGSISEIQIYRIFRSLGYQELVAFELARLTTIAPQSQRYLMRRWRTKRVYHGIADYQSERIGYLPQGAPTSPMLSNLAMRGADKEIESAAKAFGLRYTRYSDDLTFSTMNDFDRKRARQFIAATSNILRKIGLKLNPKKTAVVPPGGRKVVLGLLTDGASPRLTREFRSLLRQHIYYLEKHGPLEHATSRQFDTVGGMHRHIRGLIDFAKMIEPIYANEMLLRFERVNWIR